MRLRPGTDADSDAVIALIGNAWAEYPGCVMDLEGECAHLRRPASHYAGLGGSLLIGLDARDEIAGCVSMVPAGPGAVELKGLYVRAASRGTGLARALCEWVIEAARWQGAETLLLWSDTRFARAHRFYERRSFVACGAIRALGDLSNSLEYPYELPLGSWHCRGLDAGAARSLRRPLARLDPAGGSGGDDEAAEAAWTRIAEAVARDEAVAVAGWAEGRLAGAAVLARGGPALDRTGAPHRAALDRLVVAPDAPAPAAARLLGGLEAAAARAGIDRLTAEAAPGEALEALLGSGGWTVLGTVPGLVAARGTRRDSRLFWRAI